VSGNDILNHNHEFGLQQKKNNFIKLLEENKKVEQIPY